MNMWNSNRSTTCLALLACTLLLQGAAAQPSTAPATDVKRTLIVDGEIAQPLKLSAGDIAAMPHVSVQVKDHSGKPAEYSGVSVRAILLKAGVPLGQHRMRGKNLALYLTVEASDGYKAVFALPEFDDEFAERSILLADARDGAPLNATEGPFRFVVPQEKLQARWVRMVIAIHIKRD